MKIYQLLHAIVEKFVPMDESTKVSLQSEAITWYGGIDGERKAILQHNIDVEKYNTDHANDKDFEPKDRKPLQLKHKVVGALELWYVRYLIAISFVYLVPKIKSYINGEDKTVDEDEDDDDDDFRQFMEYRRFKQSRI